jgi:hypothetical protein
MGFITYGKNLVNSLKFYLNRIFTKLNLVGHTCLQKFGVLIQVSKWIDLKIRNEFEFEIQTKLAYDFIQASTVHSEILLHYCSYYTNTRVPQPTGHSKNRRPVTTTTLTLCEKASSKTPPYEERKRADCVSPSSRLALQSYSRHAPGLGVTHLTLIRKRDALQMDVSPFSLPHPARYRNLIPARLL